MPTRSGKNYNKIYDDINMEDIQNEDLVMKPFIPRVGSKYNIQKILIPIIEKQNFKTYIEPFVGGGCIYFGINFKNNVEKIINDFDGDLIFLYEMFKNGFDKEIIDKYYIKDYSVEIGREIDLKEPENDFEKVIKIMNKLSNTFMSAGRGLIYKKTNPYNRVKRTEITEKLNKNTKIYNKDFYEVVKKYDNEDAFIFLDPPYENSGKLYKYGEAPIVKLINMLPSIKGKFMFTMNDSPNIRKFFKDYYITPIIVPAKSSLVQNSFGSKPREEVIITNFKID